MQKKSRKQLIEYGLLGALALTLYLTGWHTEVIGYLQRGILATGLMDPNIEKPKEDSVSEAPVTADFNFNLIDSDGKQVAMQEFEGKTIFMNLWATWCPPCIAEMPGINKLFNELQSEDIHNAIPGRGF
jgi:thiol-disulfide isomerase/thioredoxin